MLVDMKRVVSGDIWVDNIVVGGGINGDNGNLQVFVVMVRLAAWYQLTLT